ncbi:MAG: hypothetical protein V4552_00890 [Pseudomonadota bacterium]
MLKHSLLNFTMALCFSLNIANATAINEPSQKSFNDFDISDAQVVSTQQLSPNSPFYLSLSENEAWIQQKLGNDFYSFYDKKIKNKLSKKSSLKLDYYLNGSSTINIKNSQISKLPVIDKSIQPFDFSAPFMRFSDDELQWNPAEIAIVKMGDDYKKFVDDEVLAGQTYKEFWDGVETSAFEDFIDEHFAFHDNALFRVLIMLAGFLVLTIIYASRARLAALISPEEDIKKTE